MIRSAVSLFLILAAAAHGSVIVFDGTVLPEEFGWQRQGTNDADRWIDDGWFVQSMDLGDWGPPPFGENDKYELFLTEFAGSSHFFAEARMSTDGPPSEVPGVAPASFLLSSSSTGVRYQLTISNGLVRFINYNVPSLYFDIAPDVPHTFRFDVFDDQLYELRIDGVLVDSGLPNGLFPSDDAFIFFGGRYYENHNTNRWDYIRFGSIPEPTSAAIFATLGCLMAVHGRRS